MTFLPLPARQTQAPVAIPFSLGGTTSKVWRTPVNTPVRVDRVLLLSQTGFGENVAFGLQRSVAFDDVTLKQDGVAEDGASSMVAHNLETGDGPVRVTNSGGALPRGLTAGTDYYVIRVDATRLAFAASVADALAGKKVSLGDAGSGTTRVIDQSTTKRRIAFATKSEGGQFSEMRIDSSSSRVVPPSTDIEIFSEGGTVPSGTGLLEATLLR